MNAVPHQRDIIDRRRLQARLDALAEDGEPARLRVTELLKEARATLAFGVQTWPHALARAMLAEQVCHAASILAGTPYHRD